MRVHEDLLSGVPKDRRCIIVGGADINCPKRIKQYLQPDDFIICCDSGLKHRKALGVTPDLIVGDFDSHENPHLPVETIVLPREKDDTDTVFAVKEGLKRGFDTYLLIGVMGGRMDHALGNLSILYMLDQEHKHAMAVDDFSEYAVVGTSPVQVSDRYPYFSLLTLTGRACGVTIRNAKYPLENAEITPEYQYGISNEVIPGEKAEVSVAHGRLLLIAVLDR